MGKKFSKRVENTVGKEKIARYEQFLLFQQCFQKACTADTQGLFWKGLKDNFSLSAMTGPANHDWIGLAITHNDGAQIFHCADLSVFVL